jgi:hypothetical protein
MNRALAVVFHAGAVTGPWDPKKCRAACPRAPAPRHVG